MTASFLFSGIISRSSYDGISKVVGLSIAEEDLTYTTIDSGGIVRVHSIEDAFTVLTPSDLLVFVTSDEIVTNKSLLAVTLDEKTRFFKKPTLQLSLSFVGDDRDHKKLRNGVSVQVFLVMPV